MQNYVPMQHAREELRRIDSLLGERHLLIGGLAVQQYYQARLSEDIDLVCPSATANAIITKLYPTRHFNIEDRNDDALRPAWVLTERSSGRVTQIGPKITERDSYDFVDYETLLRESRPYRMGAEELENVAVPTLEALALLKLLALVSRLQTNPSKGEVDLSDFVNLTNLSEFRVNAFLDLIPEGAQEHLATKIAQLTQERGPLFTGSTLHDAFSLLMPQPVEPLPHGKSNFFSPDRALEFYGAIAEKYDRRNSAFLYEAHQKVIGEVRALIDVGGINGVFDVGCGTGRNIASHFVHREIDWIGIDGSPAMLEQFVQNTAVNNPLMRSSTCQVDLSENSFADIPTPTLGSEWLAIFAFVLTSLRDSDPLEAFIQRFPGLKAIVIADIHPLYTSNNPYYDFETDHGDIALKPRPVYPDLLEHLLRRYGFEVAERNVIRKTETDEPYAFVHTFERSV